MQRLSGSPVKPLPTTPPSLGTTSRRMSRPESVHQSQSSDSLSNGITMMPSSASKRLSGQPAPRPTPIPIPEPVGVSHSSRENSNDDPSSSESATSALASVNAELVHHGGGGARHSHSNSLSPSSPRETNTLLGESTVAGQTSTPNPRTSAVPSATYPYRSTVEPTSSPFGNSAAVSVSSRLSQNVGDNRPHSSADQWGIRPSSLHSFPGDQRQPLASSSRSQSPSADSVLRPAGPMPRSRSSNFINTPSPLNPNSLPVPRRPGSTSSRPASMVLYRLAGIGDDFNPQMSSLSPPVTTNSRRASGLSTLSSSGSIFSDSKYPVPAREDGSLTPPLSGAFLQYEYDPSWDQDAPDDAEDALHAPDPPDKKEKMSALNFRGFCNVCVMTSLLTGLICIFILYPVVSYYAPGARTDFFSGQTTSGPASGGSTNSTSTTRTSSVLIDPDTPDSVKSKTGVNGDTYQLVFSDEFNTNGRTFNQGDDPFWEAVGLYDTKNNDLNWYDPGQVTTANGSLVITMAKQQTDSYQYTSGMLQSWNKFCFQAGYIEVSVSLPGNDQNTGFTPQAYTMGNLARSGYGATEQGLWPYSYDTCDNAVLENQGLNNGLSTLPAQRLSACTCATELNNGNHPGPPGTQGNTATGRGSPQIDILGYQSQQNVPDVVSESLRVAPFSTGGRTPRGVTIESTADTTLNAYTGDFTQQVISALTTVPATSYVEGGAQFTAFGYEHLSNGGVPTGGSLHWMKSGTQTFSVTGTALGGDDNVSQRLITEEPMYIVLSLALSQAVVNELDPTTLDFPATFLVDYVRVYQIEGQNTRISCDPSDYPTATYINNHGTAYTDATLSSWSQAGYSPPANSQEGDC